MTIAAKTTFAFLMLLGVAACNTVEGVGEDLEKAGDHIEERAEDANPDK